MFAVECKSLSKRYGHGPFALRDLSLHISSGEVYGYLGPNGAGKSTTIRTLLNFIQPTSGSASILGLDIVKDSLEVKKHIGYLSGDIALYPKVSGQELLDYLSSLQGMNDQGYRKKLEKRFQANLNKPIGQLSKGNRQKIGLIQAFMHEPDVLILDEPTSGLDPLMQEAFYATVTEAKERGAGLLMSSHNLNEAQRTCDRVGIIKDGRLIHEQAVSGELTKPTFRVTLENQHDLVRLKKATHLKFMSLEGEVALVQIDGSLKQALKSLSDFDIRELTTQQLSLENEFMEFYGDDK